MQILLKFAKKIKTFASIEHGRRFQFVLAFIYSGIYRAFILFVPFNKLKTRMGDHRNESPMEVDIASYRVAREVRWAVIQAARHTPWKSKCLVQALTAQRMMKNKGVSTTIYLGVKKNQANGMIAHAWIRCGSYYITGGDNRWGYAVVAKFAS